ncbi:low affinity iron permease family protein [Uliginosibacterium sp. sgz301328]|uniref:low affinity iron permease family protein n=1 Tax=Uliginosibacterium sp. sgz301328 TaxID=3243764 RepID=UPI00359F00C4
MPTDAVRAGSNWFGDLSRWLSDLTGKAGAFIAALTFVLAWAVSGPIFGFSDTWQLVINTSTTIITFLMVFLMQSSQNRDTRALQIKLDELIRATQGAHNALMSLESLSEDELAVFQDRFACLADKAKRALNAGLRDTDSPELDESAKA